MRRLLLRRLVASIPVLLGVLLVVMLTLDLIPGDPVAMMLGENAPPEQVAALRRSLGLDRPLPVRYIEYVGKVLQGDLGRSVRSERAVIAEIADVWPNTLQITVAAMVLAIAIGVTLGSVSVLWPNGWLDSLIRIGALFGLSMPIFWIGLLLIYLFGFYLRLLPVGGSGGIQHLILPALTLSLPSIAIISRMARSSLLEVQTEDYMRTARAKGLRETAILLRHGLRNAMIPVVTVIGLQFGQLMGGAILTETVFAWPGLGRLMLHAISTRDFTLLQGAVLVFAVSFVLVNFVVDLAYAWLDPRITFS